MESHDVFLSLILCMYGVAIVHLSVQAYRLVKYKHQLASFQSLFIQFNLVWALLRFVYFVLGLADYQWDRPWKQILLYWIPYVIQYSTFSLLVLFYAYLVHRMTLWKTHRDYLLGAYLLSNIVQYVFLATWISIGASKGRTTQLEQDVTIYAGTVNFVLCMLLAVYGYKVHRTPVGYHAQILYQSTGYSWPALTCILFLCFGSRSIHNLYYAFDDSSPDTFHEKVNP
eukprot:TRINITY_DN11077_c0_g1_i1.p1 TRINITY_DN11077_c0_g1~~TRINITY_DN11077_c0_g1_i1.p1  ORF type:complete len:227 (-),score=36.01 TRINITY_DN11077_c0_g1_i1:145-825(-)